MSIHSDIYVSMTTIPSRFKNIFPCIDSLLNQLFLPTKIIINIPLQYDFRFNNYVISEDEIQDSEDTTTEESTDSTENSEEKEK